MTSRGLLLVLAVAAALAGCGGTQEAAPPAETAQTGGSARIAGTTLDGERVSLDDFRGRPVLVNVWSSW